MLTAAERWGGGDGERPFLPRAFSVLRAGAGELQFLIEDVGPGTRRLCELAARRARCSWSVRSETDSHRRARVARRCSSAAASGSRRSRSGRTSSGPATALAWVSRRSAMPRRGSLLKAPTVATDDGTRRPPRPSHRAARATSSTSAPRMSRSTRAGRRRCSRPSARSAPSRGGPGPARARVRRWRAASVRASGASSRRATATSALCVDGPVFDGPARSASCMSGIDREFCGIELEHPIINASGTFDAIAARACVR